MNCFVLKNKKTNQIKAGKHDQQQKILRFGSYKVNNRY